MAEPLRRSTGIPLFGAGKLKVAITATDAATQMVREAIVTHGLAVPNESPTAMDKAIDAATFYLQRLGRFPTQEAIDKCRTENDLETLLEAFEDDPLDFRAEPFLKRSVSYHLAERSMVAYLTGHGEIYLDICVITSPTSSSHDYTVTMCDVYPGVAKAGVLYFYREPYWDTYPVTGEATEREIWHPLVPVDFPIPVQGETATHLYSHRPALTATVPPVLTGPPLAPPMPTPATQGRSATNQLDHGASGRAYNHISTASILSNTTFDSDLIAGELAIRIALETPSYHVVENAIKAASNGKKAYVAKSNFFTKRVTAALEHKAKQMGITKDAMRTMFQEARKEAKQAEKEGRVFTLSSWVIS